MNTAIRYIESVENFDDLDGEILETVSITEALRGIYMAGVDALTEAKELIEKDNGNPLEVIDHLIIKYKKKI